MGINMPIIISQIKGALGEDKSLIIQQALKAVEISSDKLILADIYKTSLDARKQNDIHFVHSVFLELNSTTLEINLCNKYSFCSLLQSIIPMPIISKVKRDGDIIIAGFGPCGMFAGLMLAEFGYNPIVLERGEAIDERIASVDLFWNGGDLNVNSNVQFGEGGAGTFSDGKLTTRIKDPLCRYVLEKLVENGAPSEILVKSKPHIGTDNLRLVVKAIRNRIIELGGQVIFNSSVNNLEIKNNSLKSVFANSINYKSQALVLAVGHSARDTFKMLLDNNVYLESKAFSVGARIEHLQKDVNFSLYGKHCDNPLLPQGEYQLAHRMADGRAVYTFCMCPGGVVVPSSSEHGGVVTNGMSEYSRNGVNANSALVVSVSKDDFGNNPLDGLDFARSIERKAFTLAGENYSAPAVSVGSFLDGGSDILESRISSTYSRNIVGCNFNELFPPKITDMMRIGLRCFSSQMECFKDKSAILTAPETRTSSPVRITRGADFQSVSTKNLYPCGEGAGYAGGIISAAVDGIKVAMKIMESYAP